jgi:hypothetical protein
MMRKYAIGLTLSIFSVILFFKYTDWFVFPALRAVVNTNLKDPESTQYRNERLSKDGWICGELNSKNAMGAYVGFKRFAASKDKTGYLENEGYFTNGASQKSSLDVKFSLHSLKARKLIQENTGQWQVSNSEADKMGMQTMFNEVWNSHCTEGYIVASEK